MNMPRRVRTVEKASICQDMHPLSNPSVQTEADILADKERKDCPLMEPCSTGKLQADGFRCAALTGQIMARAIALDNTPAILRSEIAELSEAPFFYPNTKGFIDPYSTEPLKPETDRGKAVNLVVDYASLIIFGFKDVFRASRYAESEYGNDAIDKMSAVVADDMSEVVYPNGIPKRVSRNVCRCPILRVGDFCPVHGG